MSLTKIYSSKLYLTSSRKDRIHAAIQDPINLELVQQVAAYLDDDSKDELKQAIAEKEAKSASSSEPSEPIDNENVFDTPDSGSAPSFHGGGHSSGGFSSGNVFDDFDSGTEDFPDTDTSDSEDMDIPEPEANPSDVDTPTDAEPVEENTAVTQEEVISAEDINAEDETAVLQSGIIKKLLNDQEDTSGVVRVDIGDTEAWIYYDDKINLNDIFDNVIALLKDSKYDMLKFSRLARTDNAVVFDIKE